MRRVLYWKRLLIVVAVACVFATGVFAVHRVQVKGQVTILKERAERAEAEINGDSAKRAEVISLYARYLKFRPSDEPAFQKYATLLFEQAGGEADLATKAKTAAGVESFLRAFPSHSPERQKLAELYAKTGKLLNAKQHVEMLFTATNGNYKTNIEVLELAANCEQGLGDLSQALTHLEAAINTKNAPVRVYKRALEINYANKNDRQRNVNIASLLEALLNDPRFKNDLSARVAVAQFQRFTGELQNSRTNITYALTQIPGGAEDPEALLAAAELEITEIRTLDQAFEKLKLAEDYLRKASAKDPTNVAVGAQLAEVLARQNKREDGVETLLQTARRLTKVNDDFVMVIDRLIDLGEQKESQAMVERIAQDETRKSLTTYFRGRLAVLKKDWIAAQTLLEEASINVQAVPIFYKKAMVGLAACYAAKQNPDKQLEYCRLARRVDPGYPLAMIGEAEALNKMGKTTEALQLYRILVNEYQILEFRAEYVRLKLFSMIVRLVEPKSEEWKQFDADLGPVETRTPELHILHADSLVARGQPAEAEKILSAWIQANPKHEKAGKVATERARLTAGGRAENAWAILEESQKQIGDNVDIRIAKANLLVLRGRTPRPEELEALTASAGAFSAPDQFRLWLGVGQATGRAADTQPDAEAGKALRAVAIKQLRAAADLLPKDLTSRAYLLDYSIAANRMEVVNQVLKEIGDIEGKDGPFSAMGYIAIRLPEALKMADAKQRSETLKELRELTRRVRDSRPGWSRVYIAIARIDEAEGLNDAALQNYQQAIEKGDRQEIVIRRAVDLYRVKKQDDLAVIMLNKLSTEIRLADDLERFRSIHNLVMSTELPKNSLPTVDRIAPAESKNYRDQLLRGSLLVTLREHDAALAAFRRAVELNDKLPETWASLVAQLVRINKLDDAKRAVAQAEKALSATLPAMADAQADLRIGMGGLQEMVGDINAANEHFLAAVKLAPLELNPIRQLVMFYQRTGQSPKADELMMQAKDSTAQDIARWARRSLALTLMSRPNAYNDRNKALALIDENLKIKSDDPEDVKARAVILTVDPATREDGIRILRGYGDRGDLTPDEFYLLGRLAFDRGVPLEAKDYFRAAGRVRPGVTPEHLAAVVRVHLALRLIVDAENALERLKANNPNSWEAVREEARLLLYKSKDRNATPEATKKLITQAREAILKFPKWDAVENIPSKTGPLLEELSLTTDAEAIYKKYLAESKQANAHLPLSLFYIRQKQSDKVIELAFEHEPKTRVLVTASLLTGGVRAKRPDAALEAKIEKWLTDALAKAATDPELEAGLIGSKAELFDARGQYAEAIKEYERSIAAYKKIPNPQTRNDAIVNNLAMLLSLHQPARANEAVKMMSELIAIRGPVPVFLDTRSVAYLVSSRPSEAAADLRLALVQYDRATYHFHLAWAHDLNVLEGERILAVDELRAAKARGLSPDDLHAIEYQKYRALMEKYKLPLD